MKKQLFYLYATAGRLARAIGPTDQEIRATVRLASPVGMYSSAADSLEIEQTRHAGINRLATHVALFNERTSQRTPLLKIVSRETETDPPYGADQPAAPGTYLLVQTTHGEREVPLEEALMLLRLMEEGKVLRAAHEGTGSAVERKAERIIAAMAEPVT